VGSCPFQNGAPDLLSLDVREAATPAGQPVLWFRVAMQTNAADGPRAIHVGFTVDGKPLEVDWTSLDGKAYTTSAFEAIAGPTPVGDGHPQALDGMLSFAALGVAAGAKLAAFQVESRGSTEDGDVMPGGWTANGAEVASVPNPSEPGVPFPGAYTLAGPARLVDASPMGTLDLAQGKDSVMLHVTNRLAASPQFVRLHVVAPPGVAASFEGGELALDGGAMKMATLRVGSAVAPGTLNLTVTSDLGAYLSFQVPYNASPPPASTGPASTGPSAKASSILPLVPVVVAILLGRRRA
jgi:hypothetical protein